MDRVRTAIARATKANPPHEADGAMVSNLAWLGIVPGVELDATKLSSDQLQAINDGYFGAP